MHGPSRHVLLQTLVEIDRANYAVNDRDQDQKNGDDGERCQTVSCRQIIHSSVVIRKVHAGKLEDEICECCKVENLWRSSISNIQQSRVEPCRAHTRMKAIPTLFSCLAQYAARKSKTIVTGIAAIVSRNSKSVVSLTTTKNWTVKARKKKKSNLINAM